MKNEHGMEKPSRFTATPQEILDWMRGLFAEDTLTRFHWVIGDEAVREAGMHEAADLIDPDEGAGHYPAKLVCGHHGTDGASVGQCGGAPRCWHGTWGEKA